MTDIVDELRSHFSGTGIIKSATSDLVKNAAAEIERLQDEVVSLGITLVGVEEVNALLRAENATLLAAAQAAPRMTFDEWFLKFSSWGLSHQQLLTCAFAPGSDPGDDVYTSPSGSVMTRHICSHWINFYGAAQAGWNAALSSAQRAGNQP
jgi:hypothetical protein